MFGITYSGVPNKRGGGSENNRGGGGWKWFNITVIGGWNNREGGLGEIENSRFLGKHVSFIYLCEQ